MLRMLQGAFRWRPHKGIAVKRWIQRLVTLALALAISPVALCDPSETLVGTWQFVADGSDDIAAAIEGSVAKMNFIKRPIARSRLKKTNSTYRTIRIERQPDLILVAFDAGKPVGMPIDGTKVKWQRDDGEKFDVSGQWQESMLKQAFVAEDGERRNEFRLSEDGSTLTLAVTLTSGQLLAPVKYTLAYKRAP